MRSLYLQLLIVLGMLLGGVAVAHAETTPANVKYSVYYTSDGYTRPYLFTKPEACADFTAWYRTKYNSPTVTWSVNSTGNGCSTTGTGGYTLVTGYFCPSGSTLSGSGASAICTYATSCTGGQIRNQQTGVCENPSCATGTHWDSSSGSCVADCTAGTSNSYSGTTATVVGDMPSSVCFSGCTYNFSSRTGVGGQTYGGVGANTGESCTATTQLSGPSESNCASQGKSFVTMNGSTQCVDAGTPNAPEVKSNTTSTSSTTSNGNTSNTTTNTTTTVNNNTVTVTNTHTTVTNGTTTVTSDTSTQPINTYCQNNPASSICTNGSVSTGSGNGSGSGSGTMNCEGCATESTLSQINGKLDVTGTITSGTYPSQPNSFYTSAYPDGISGVWNNFTSQVNNSSAINVVHALAPSDWVGGTAPMWSIDFSGLHPGWSSYELAPDSMIWNAIKIIFIITTLFLCRRIIFGG